MCVFCVHLYVDICVCTFGCGYVRMYVYMYVCLCTLMCVCTKSCYLFNHVEESSTHAHSVGTITTVRSDDGQHLTTGDQPATGGRKGKRHHMYRENVRGRRGREEREGGERWEGREGGKVEIICMPYTRLPLSCSWRLTDEMTASILHRTSCGSESVCLSVFPKSIITI